MNNCFFVGSSDCVLHSHCCVDCIYGDGIFDVCEIAIKNCGFDISNRAVTAIFLDKNKIWLNFVFDPKNNDDVQTFYSKINFQVPQIIDKLRNE